MIHYPIIIVLNKKNVVYAKLRKHRCKIIYFNLMWLTDRRLSQITFKFSKSFYYLSVNEK